LATRRADLTLLASGAVVFGVQRLVRPKGRLLQEQQQQQQQHAQE
jgi:hypothetical protein